MENTRLCLLAACVPGWRSRHSDLHTRFRLGLGTCSVNLLMQQRALVLQRRAFAVATTVVGTTLLARHLEGQRRPLKGCNASGVSEALSHLQASGVCVVENVVDHHTIDNVKATELWATMPTSKVSSPRRSALESKKSKLEQPDKWRASSMGRYHRREEAFDEKDVKVFEQVEQRIWPLVKAFFEEDSEHGMRGIYRSEMQILNAVPGSMNQTWHSDNKARGLTIIVPLVGFSAENGATQVLVGSHNSSWPLVVQQGARVVEASVGAIAAYDSRTFHRGLGNQTADGRPALIFCYDRSWSPPPGVSSFGSMSNAYLAGLLNVASAAWLTLTS